jgi:hypothetical protein
MIGSGEASSILIEVIVVFLDRRRIRSSTVDHVPFCWPWEDGVRHPVDGDRD